MNDIKKGVVVASGAIAGGLIGAASGGGAGAVVGSTVGTCLCPGPGTAITATGCAAVGAVTGGFTGILAGAKTAADNYED